MTVQFRNVVFSLYLRLAFCAKAGGIRAGDQTLNQILELRVEMLETT